MNEWDELIGHIVFIIAWTTAHRNNCMLYRYKCDGEDDGATKINVSRLCKCFGLYPILL